MIEDNTEQSTEQNATEQDTVEQDIVEQASPEQETAAAEQKPGSSRLLKVWYASMIFCTLSLCVIGVVFNDSSVYFFVLLGVIAICVTPVVRIIKAVVELNALKQDIELRKYEEHKRKTVDRMANLTLQEREELEREKRKAAIEFARRHAAKSESLQENPQESPQNI